MSNRALQAPDHLHVSAAVVAAAAIVLLGPGCRGTAEQRLPSGVFVFSSASDPETFDPGVMTGAVEGRIAYQLFEGLYVSGPGDVPVPGVAASHEVTPDGLTWTFHLRPDARWSNGDPLTANDFVYAWLRILRGDVACDYINFLRYLRNGRAFEEGQVGADAVGVVATSDHQLVVTLESPVPWFLELMTFYTFFPVHEGTIERFGQEEAFRPENIVSNGAFRMVTYRRRNSIEMERNPHYWDVSRVELAGVRSLIIEDLAANVTAFGDGRLDWTDNIPNNQLPALRGRDDFRFGSLLGTYYYRFNTTVPPLDDARVRRALTLAINREEMCRCTLDDLYLEARSFVPELPDRPVRELVAYDPDEARRLLAESGFPGGVGFPALHLLYNTSENHRAIAQAMQDQWQMELGISVELVNEEWKVYLASVEALDYEVARAGWIGDYRDPNTFLEMWRTGDENNRTGWSNAEYDALITSSLLTPDVGARAAMLLRAEEILLAEAPILPLYYYGQFHLVHPRVRGWEMNTRDIHVMRFISVDGEVER